MSLTPLATEPFRESELAVLTDFTAPETIEPESHFFTHVTIPTV